MVREGLATLHVLNLEGYPASDVVGATANVWVSALWNTRKREWHKEADTPCIREAFRVLADTCNRWPSPAKFWEVLPERKPFEGQALPPRVFTEAERAENLKKLGALIEGAFRHGA